MHVQALASCDAFSVALQVAAELCSDGPAPAALAAQLAELLRALRPEGQRADDDTWRKGGSLSAAAVLHQLRGQLPPGTLRAGEEHDAAEALELLLQAVSCELRAAFKRGPTYPRLLARSGLDAVLGRRSGGDPLLQAWQAGVRLPCEVRRGLLVLHTQYLVLPCTRSLPSFLAHYSWRKTGVSGQSDRPF
jgi:hypothetical protein